MITKIFRMTAVGIATVLLSSSAAFAVVTFDPETGEGYVPKGDLQTTLPLKNNAGFQDAAETGFEFRYRETILQSVECEQQQTNAIRQGTRTQAIGGEVDYSEKKVVQVSGIRLTGFVGDGPTSEEFGPWEDVDGNEVDIPGACFNQGQGWDQNAFEEVTLAGVLEARVVGTTTWYALPLP